MTRKPHDDSIIDMFARLGRDLRLPAPDIERVIEHNRRNLEAFERSARAASSGTAGILKLQQEMLREMMEDTAKTMQSVKPGGDPRDIMASQSEFARKAFERAVRNTGEIAELMRGSGAEAVDIWRERMRETITEMREGFEARQK